MTSERMLVKIHPGIEHQCDQSTIEDRSFQGEYRSILQSLIAQFDGKTFRRTAIGTTSIETNANATPVRLRSRQSGEHETETPRAARTAHISIADQTRSPPNGQRFIIATNSE